MPGAWEILGIDKDLRDKILDAIASEAVDITKLERHGIRAFCERVRRTPSALLHIEGFDECKVADLIDRMTRAGYFEDN